MRSYYNWIGGLGDTSLSNDDLSSNCLYPSVPFLLTHDQIFNNDILYSQDVSNEYQFSKLYNRVITIKCTKDQSVSYHQSNSIYNSNPAKIKRNHWHTLSNNNNNFDSNAYILHLTNTTQTTWIRCGKHYNFHISLLPLSIINAQLYSIKTRQIANNFKDKLPPNIVILVIDSTSRSSFMRTAHSCVDYLTSLLNNPIESPSHILQFFRYSTIGWGTAVNMNGLISGVCSHDNCGGHANTNWSNCVGLAQYYNKLGYYVIGYNEHKDNIDKFKWQSESGCDFYLSENVVPKPSRTFHRFDVDVFANDIALFSINELQKHYDNNIPYFMILHAQANHIDRSLMMFQLDKYIKHFLQKIDKENTIIHLISDHGVLVGDALKNLYGRWEISNPISIMIIPNNSVDIKYLKQNQQTLVNHYDFHQFYKEFMYKLVQNENIINFENDVKHTLPKLSNGTILSQSILTKQMKSNRNCIGIAKGFCFCNMFKNKIITPKLIENDQKYINLVINTVNNLTGNGNWNCLKLNPNDFTVSLHMINADKNIEIVIEYKQYNLSDNEYEKLRKQNKWLSFLAYITLENDNDFFIPLSSHYSSESPKIIRIDLFKYEKCLTTEYNDRMRKEFEQYDEYFAKRHHKSVGVTPEPIFVDKNMTIKMLKQQKLWNLRVCKCKTF